MTVRRVLLAEHRVDFRRQFDGLLAEAYRLGAQPYDGDCIIFIKKDRTQIRALVGDNFGLYLVYRRFEGGRLGALLAFADQPRAKTISTGELSLLLEGSTFTVHKRATAWRAPVREAQQPPPAPTVQLFKGPPTNARKRRVLRSAQGPSAGRTVP